MAGSRRDILLIDGTNIGGPGVTFPQPDLNARFANTVVFAGSSRTFGARAVRSARKADSSFADEAMALLTKDEDG